MSKLLPQQAVIKTLAVLTVVIGALLFGPNQASAQSCIEDVWKAHGNNQELTCTANDVTLSRATNITIAPGAGGDCNETTGVCRCFADQLVTFTATFRMDLTAQTRYDVGFYIETGDDTIAQDGALTGTCQATASLAGNTTNFINLDPQNTTPKDVCGDITGPLNTANNPLFVRSTITTMCPAAGQQMVLPFCTTWRQPGSNGTCTSANDAYPGSPSKCNCGDLAIDIFSAPVDFSVAKDPASNTPIPESGGPATFNVVVTNNSGADLTLTSLTDAPFGNIAATHGGPTDAYSVTSTTCQPDGVASTCEVGGSIAAGGQCSCMFTANVPPGDFPGTHTDTVTVCGNNIFNTTPVCHTDPATVNYSDVPQPPSLTKTATDTQCQIDQRYAIVVTNGSGQDQLTLNTLTDDVYGTITSAHAAGPGVGEVVSTTCSVPQTIATNDNYSCSFVGRMTSCGSLTDTVSASATDDDGRLYDSTTTPALAPDSATVVVTVQKP